MKRLYRAFDIHFKNITSNDYDGVFLITGDEGKGKSNVLLHLLDYWYTKLNGECVESDSKHACLTMQQFSEDLKDCVKFEATGYDEAGDISNKRSMSKLNVALSQAYQVIRGDNLCTFMVLPSLFDLDGFFTKRRARGLIHITKRGALQYYSQKRLRKIIALNQSRIIKSLSIVRPTFVDTFPKYNGVLLQPYLDKKAEKMKEIRNNLYKELNEKSQDNQRDEIIINMAEDGYTQIEIAKAVRLSRERVGQIIRGNGNGNGV